MLPLMSSGQIHYTVCFAPCGRWLTAGGSEWAVDVWDLHAPQNPPARMLSNLGAPIVRLAFAPTGNLIVVTSSQILMTDPTMTNVVSTRHTGTVSRAAVAGRGERRRLRRRVSALGDLRTLNRPRLDPKRRYQRSDFGPELR
jgi:hypothetical protein